MTRRQRNNNNTVTKAQCHNNSNRASPVSSRESNCSPGLNSAYRAMVSLAGNRTPSIEQSCLTETTDCPSDISVITSISAVPTSSHVSSHVSQDPTDLIQSRLAGFSLHGDHHPDVIQVHRVPLGHSRESDEELIQRVSDTSRGIVTLPPTHLRALVRDRLRAEGISLSAHPYTQVSRVVTKKLGKLFHPSGNKVICNPVRS